MKKILWCLAAVFLLLTGCSSSQNGQDRQNSSTATPVSSSAPTAYVMCGTVTSNHTVNISSMVSSRITKLYVDLGDRVKVGDPIASLDTQAIRAQLLQAKAGVTAAQDKLAQLKEAVTPEQMATAKAAVDDAKKDYDIAQKQYNSLENLSFKGAANTSVSVQYNTQLNQAAAAVTDAKYKYIAAENNLEVLEKGATEAEIGAAEASVEQLQATVDAAQIQLKEGTVTSPVSGTVTALNTGSGAVAAAGVPLVTISDEHDLYISANLPLEYLNEYPVGKNVNIKISNTSENSSENITGKVIYVDSVLNQQNNEVLIKISLDSKDSPVRVGQFAEISLEK